MSKWNTVFDEMEIAELDRGSVEESDDTFHSM